MTTQDYEILYKNLKEETDKNKEINDEIFKEYDSTIQLLTENAQKYEKEKKDFQNKISKIEIDIKNIKQEKENLIKKNKDKLIDIQCLNQQNESLNKLVKKYKEEKITFDTKIVTLENDVEHYQNKIREYEDFIEELKSQLETSLEENITLQTEFETYKLNTGEQLIRKEEEIKEIKNDINYKDKLILKLSQNPDEKFDIKNLQQKLIKEKKIINTKRRFSVLESNFMKIGTPNFSKFPNSKNKNGKTNGNNYFKENSFNSGIYTPKDIKINNSDKKNKLINSEKKPEINKEMNGLNTIEQKLNNKNSIIKKFDILSICNGENNFYINSNYNMNNNINRKNEFEKELKNMMISIQKRKNILLNLKQQINEKLLKLEFRKK